MKKLVIGILAHVDAGKTTLSESMLYLTGNIRTLGRVDHKNTFLDTYELERARGITIFSKQAVLSLKDMEVTLIDTPGHVDFSSEMERTLQVLDYAVLVINGNDGIQGHTETLWRLLSSYRIPTFLFINKMDMEGTNKNELMVELKNQLNDGCVDFCSDQDQKIFMENIAMCDDKLLESYIESGSIGTENIAELIVKRKIFPCYFGSALKLDGVEEFMKGMELYTNHIHYPKEFGAKIFKIARDAKGNRLTYMKITGGSLKIKMLLTNSKEKENSMYWSEKPSQIRIYSGEKYETVDKADAGTVCAVTGLTRTYPGEGLGTEYDSVMPILEPVLNYKILLPVECDAYSMLSKLRQLEEEDPGLHIMWSEPLKEIHVQMMGEVQIEIIKSLILERFGMHVEFDSGNIVYKETISEPVVGVGHFEPLRHYAQVHLLLEPSQVGSGLTFTTSCNEDVLDHNWQRSILNYLEEKEHLGVLTGSLITDIKITLISGRAHKKHTESGDFKEATHRAVRQGLKKANCVLLEPYYNFNLEIPTETVGRAMADIGRMYGKFNSPETNSNMSILSGYAPVSTMQGYQLEVNSYTKGRGRMSCALKGYEPCHNSEDVIQENGYDSEKDLENPTGSIFCQDGSGFSVKWDEVENYMHIDSEWDIGETNKPDDLKERKIAVKPSVSYSGSWKEDKELEEIFNRTFGMVKNKSDSSKKNTNTDKLLINQHTNIKNQEPMLEYLLVDGYNIIFAWDELHELAKVNLEAARNKLMDILCNFQGYKKCTLILVFDAYKVRGGSGKSFDYHNIHVVYTKEAETADAYIEKTTHEIARKHHVTVATSDAMEQLIIMGQGATRLSANDLKEEVIRVSEEMSKFYLDKQSPRRSFLGELIYTIKEE